MFKSRKDGGTDCLHIYVGFFVGVVDDMMRSDRLMPTARRSHSRWPSFIWIFALFASLTVGFSVVHAKEYGSYDLRRVLTASEKPDGKKFGIDTNYLDRILEDLALHARNYPPRFDTPEDRQRAIADAKALSEMLGVVVNGPSAHPDLLLRAGFLNSMGHNLDIPGSAEKTLSIFQRLLAAAPDHPRGNYTYGTFLAGVGKSKDAIPYLKKALGAGVVDAAYALGMTYLTLGDKQKALENLANYKQQRPNDQNVDRLIEGIRSGTIEIKRVHK